MGEGGLVVTLTPFSYHKLQLPHKISNGSILMYFLSFMFSEQLVKGKKKSMCAQVGGAEVFHNSLSKLQLEGALEGYFPGTSQIH